MLVKKYAPVRMDSSQVAVGQGQRSQPGHESGGRAIWTVNAVDHGGVTFRSGRPHCSQRRGQRKRRSRKGRLLLGKDARKWLASEAVKASNRWGRATVRKDIAASCPPRC